MRDFEVVLEEVCYDGFPAERALSGGRHQARAGKQCLLPGAGALWLAFLGLVVPRQSTDELPGRLSVHLP